MGVVDAIIRLYGTSSDFTVSELADRLVLHRSGVNSQSVIADTFNKLVKTGVIKQGKRTVDGILCTIKNPLFIKWYQVFMGTVGDHEADLIYRAHSTVESVKPFVIVPSKTVVLPPLTLAKLVQTERRPGWVPRQVRSRTYKS